MRVKVYAELGSNPAPGWQLEPFVQAAARAGADGVKVQVWATEHFPEPEWAAKRPLEFPRARLGEFARLAHAYGLTAGASVFDENAVQRASDTVDWLKLAAREQANYELMDAVVRAGRRCYRSISAPECYEPQFPTFATVQQYPLPMGAALLQVVRWAAFFKLRGAYAWGWSSHTRGWLDVLLAVRLGALVIEKHLATDPAQPEAGHSLTSAQFGAMVARIRRAEGTH